MDITRTRETDLTLNFTVAELLIPKYRATASKKAGHAAAAAEVQKFLTYKKNV